MPETGPFDTLVATVDGVRGSLQLNRPEKLNPLSMHTLHEIELAARWFDEHHDLKVVVVSGAGRSFSAGADLTAFDEVESLVQVLLAKPKLALLETKAHVNAVTESMVGTGRSWSDADGLFAGLRDAEGRSSALAYVERLQKK